MGPIWTDTDRTYMGSTNIDVLVVVDMQEDFISGIFGSKEAKDIVPEVIVEIDRFITKGGERGTQNPHVFFTRDTHDKNSYMHGSESYLPFHCGKDTEGWELNNRIKAAVTSLQDKDACTIIDKYTFGSVELGQAVKKYIDEKIAYLRSTGVPANRINENIEIVGLCTDICVISNALLLKAFIPSARIMVNSSLCAGTTPENHSKALDIIGQNGIEVI